MIITRSPFRITLGGGGTDLPSYYQRHGGFVIAAAIDKYVYITIYESFRDDLLVKYSRLERVLSARELEHPLCLRSEGHLPVRELLGESGEGALDFRLHDLNGGDADHGLVTGF